MQIEDYEPTATTIDDTPRPNASQVVAARHRKTKDKGRGTNDEPAIPGPRYAVPFGVGAAVLILLMVGMATYQLGQAPAKPLQITPVVTEEQAQTFAVASPEARTAPIPTSTVDFTPVPTALPTTAPDVPDQTGQDLTLDDDSMQPTPTPEPVAPSYIENVGAQAPHSPRGGLCGPTGGDCAPAVPYGLDNTQYISNVGAQQPHKVR